MNIAHIKAHEILASGGLPSIEVEVGLDNGVTGVASVPYGASAGTHEATVLLDEDESRYNGNGMLRAIENVEGKIASVVVGMEAEDQRALDQAMIDLDGTPNKANLGGNAILAVSVATARAAANAQGKQLYDHIAHTFETQANYRVLPQPMVVVIEGGKHADDTTDLQEFCMSALGGGSPKENIRKVLESYHQLKGVLKANKLSTNVGNEGAFAPNGIPSNEAPFGYILEAIQKAGYTPGTDIGVSIDAAASEFYQDGMYHLAVENRSLSAQELIEYYQSWFEKYPFVTVEDPLHEDDWENWVAMKQVTDRFNLPLIGDDLTVTDKNRLQKAIDMNAISAILIKLNQIGTLTETVDTCMLAKQHGMITVPSHRGGGETNDTAMVDLAVAVNSAYIKVGPTRGERVSKYNRLMEIERLVKGGTQ